MTYRAGGDLVVAALAGDLEGDIVGGVVLDLDGAGGEVVEVLVEELEAQCQPLIALRCDIMPSWDGSSEKCRSAEEASRSRGGASQKKSRQDIHRSPPWRCQRRQGQTCWRLCRELSRRDGFWVGDGLRGR